MSKMPSPPQTDNPIVFLREASVRTELKLLTDIIAAHKAGDVEAAARCALQALASPVEREMVRHMVGLTDQLAATEQKYPAILATVLSKAVDAGHEAFAYNAANLLSEHAQTVEQWKEVERYYKVAMAFDETPQIQAAAHVNYCPIVRDGLITGVPDWQAAVEIYESAARMGLAKAMFNAGNVSSWLAGTGVEGYGARAAYWFNRVLEVRDAGEKTLDMESREQLEEAVFLEAMVALSACHIDNTFDGAQLEVGIRWAKEAAKRGSLHARHNLGVGYMLRLSTLTAKPSKSPGSNWCSVLSKMDWQFKGKPVEVSVDTDTGHVAVDRVDVMLDDGTSLPLFVVHEPCLPKNNGFALLDDVAQTIAYRHPEGFFLLPRKAVFIEQNERSYTPIYVGTATKLTQQALWMGSSPEVVIEHADTGVEFLDERFSTFTCMIPIAVNALDEGYVVAGNTKFAQPYVPVGGPWCMPFVDEAKLKKVGIVLQR
jgi:TPR repeat protein